MDRSASGGQPYQLHSPLATAYPAQPVNPAHIFLRPGLSGPHFCAVFSRPYPNDATGR